MENPVIAADTHSYEKEAIISWLKTGSMISPMTGEKLRDRSITENTTLKKAIQEFRQKQFQIQKDNIVKVDLETAIK
jgi:hypothetical protein